MVALLLRVEVQLPLHVQPLGEWRLRVIIDRQWCSPRVCGGLDEPGRKRQSVDVLGPPFHQIRLSTRLCMRTRSRARSSSVR